MRKLLVALTVLAVLLAGTPALASSAKTPANGGVSSPATGVIILGPCTGGGLW